MTKVNPEGHQFHLRYNPADEASPLSLYVKHALPPHDVVGVIDFQTPERMEEVGKYMAGYAISISKSLAKHSDLPEQTHDLTGDGVETGPRYMMKYQPGMEPPYCFFVKHAIEPHDVTGSINFASSEEISEIAYAMREYADNVLRAQASTSGPEIPDAGFRP